jgi:cytochrome c biogenesis protein CcmG/thiol:disulfide interchange protein DsbE
MSAHLRRAPLGFSMVFVGVAALFGLLVYGVRVAGPGHSIDDAIARGQRPAAPAITLPRLEGGATAALADYRGTVVVLNYWASWCTPCRQESPLLERWHKRISARRGTVLGVDSLDVTADALAFIRGFRLTYPMLRDRDGDTQKRFGVTGYPETLILDRHGRISALQRGPVDDAFLRRTVLPLLTESA